MKITVLVENTTNNEELAAEHGLSLYIETDKHNILFDLGYNRLFLENAEKLGIDISQVDMAVISHGHYDHGKGLKEFLKVNNKAKIYLNKYAFEEYYSQEKNGEFVYIGLDSSLKDNRRIIFLGENYFIDSEISIYSGIEQVEYLSPVNKSLYKKTESGMCRDDFLHEQNMVIMEDDKAVLFSGCSHSGIVNIVSQIQKKTGLVFSHVLGGFHTHIEDSVYSIEPGYINQLASKLLEFNADFFTFHCTGVEEYHQLKESMKQKIEYMATGNSLEI